MTEVKQVKVDNWGIYFLQRLKHFFNRTDYCDLTLQFQDNAQLKVHRLVLSACTEYFELLERTCEMYEDCLVMPDDLQADVVVPIVNFMYTGHLEFRMDLLERLYQTSQILNMPVLSKLLESHRMALKVNTNSHGPVKRFPKANSDASKLKPMTSTKRSYGKAFDNSSVVCKDKKVYNPLKLVTEPVTSPSAFSPSPSQTDSGITNKRNSLIDPRPTRYELPEELDQDNIFDNSFCNISYTCKPLMIHPENVKSYSGKRTGLFSDVSKKLMPGTSTVDIVECKRIPRDDNIFDDNIPDQNLNEDIDNIFQSSYKNEPPKDSSQLFDQILDDGPKVTIETKNNKVASNLDHAKIISEVLKKYPHLVKSNKNIKLKILNTPTKGKKQHKASPTYVKDVEKSKTKLKAEEPDFTYETDVIDSQLAAKLIALGAENTKGPWICLICGTPGKALHFTSYFKFRRHLVEVHNEKPVANICEYCGLRSLKRNYLLHHLYSQHGVEPPPQYNFPKCNKCNYIALTEGLLVKHKMTHKEMKNFHCNVCSAPFSTTKSLLHHIQITGHKYSAERKTNLQCIYCLKGFLRDGNLYAHLKTYHKNEAKNDGIIEDSDEDKPLAENPKIKSDRESKYHHIKFEPSTSCDNDFDDIDMQFQIQQRHDGAIQVSPRKQHNPMANTKQKILNPGFGSSKPPLQKANSARKSASEPSNFLEDISIPSPPVTDNHNDDEIVLIDNMEYIMRENQLIPRKPKSVGNEFIISDMMDSASLQAVQPTTSMDYTDVHNTKIIEEQPSILMKKTTNINQPIQIVVSNEEEYKALMSSNHPILFDNGDANKTLTVLTAPHNTAIESTAINLNNPQSNDMMIIQDDYPLNVTETVTENSNIVVVYSHPVDDPNKQFQILTTGGIGSQFVQSSAIITQNYETVTTTAPVMSAHVLGPQPNANWQNTVQSTDIQEVPIQQVPSAELHNVVANVEVKQIENESSTDLDDLPDVHIAPEPQTIVPQSTEVNDSSIKLNVINNKSDSDTIISDIQKESDGIPKAQMETDILKDNAVVEASTAILETIEPIQMTHENDNIPEILNNDVNQEIIQEQSLMETESIVKQSDTEILPTGNTEILLQSNTEILPHGNLEILPQGNTDILPQGNTEILPQGNTDILLQSNTDILPHGNLEILPQGNTEILPPGNTEILPPGNTEILPEEQQIIASLTVAENTEDSADVELHTSEDQEALPESQAYDDIVEINHITKKDLPTPYIKEAEVKIQNLTSEWSEDEYDVPEDEPVTVKPVDNAEVSSPQKSNKFEEPIENIQKDVESDNMVTTITKTTTLTATIEPLPDVETEESESSIPEDTVTSPQESQLASEEDIIVTPVQNNPVAQQKISSLLNDWEDNDSQEENNGDVPTIENNIPTPEVNKKDEPDATIEAIPKTDNIKSLVSDWDDDEEEIKNE